MRLAHPGRNGTDRNGGFGLQVALDLHVLYLLRAEAGELMACAYERCPYSEATRESVEVTLTLDGAPLDLAAA